MASGGLARKATSSATVDTDGGPPLPSRRAAWTSIRTCS